jgi:Arylsulfotransferase (ASST)
VTARNLGLSRAGALGLAAIAGAICSLLLATETIGSAAKFPVVTISPLKGTLTALPKTQISFLGAVKNNLKDIAVVGSSSGPHNGQLRSYVSQTGASFIPAHAFTPGEHVIVSAKYAYSDRTETLSDSFTVAHPVAVSQVQFPSTPGTAADVQHFYSRPELQPPAVTVNVPASAAKSAPGYIFATPYLGSGQYGPMIFNSAGQLVWFRPMPKEEDAADLTVQSYEGKRDLTWWQGRTILLGYGEGEDVIANSNYQTVATVRAGNGLLADEHEFTISPQGSAYITAYSPVETNLSSDAGPSRGIAVEGVVQEIDIKTGLVMWEWHSLSHIPLSASHSPAPDASNTPFDYFHINAIDPEYNGHLLISARNTWGIYELNMHTGAVEWTLGGKRSTFKLGPGVQFAFQHYIRRVSADEVALFDDEGSPEVKPPSRGEIIHLNFKTRTATLTRQLIRTIGPLQTASQGDVQQLPGGGWMVGWGGLPNFTEFNSKGEIVYDAQFPVGSDSYRVYREDWSGQPTEPPAIVASTTGATTSVFASWNGATNVASWQLLAGSSPTSLKAVSSTPSTGFETRLMTSVASYVQVAAVSATGETLSTSRVIASSAG